MNGEYIYIRVDGKAETPSNGDFEVKWKASQCFEMLYLRTMAFDR